MPTAEQLNAAFSEFVAVAMCAKKRNTPEFMAYFAERINTALAVLGTGDRVEWPGKWANEWHLVSGGGEGGRGERRRYHEIEPSENRGLT